MRITGNPFEVPVSIITPLQIGRSPCFPFYIFQGANNNIVLIVLITGIVAVVKANQTIDINLRIIPSGNDLSVFNHTAVNVDVLLSAYRSTCSGAFLMTTGAHRVFYRAAADGDLRAPSDIGIGEPVRISAISFTTTIHVILYSPTIDGNLRTSGDYGCSITAGG